MKIAISGSIGSGKSEACNYLRSLGYDVFDCDEENRRLLEKGNEGYLEVQKHFPQCFDEKSLDKKKLSALVFSDEKKRKKLEAIMHPLILKKLNERKDDPLFAEVPLLFECNWDVYFDHNILVVTDEEILFERLIQRGLDEKEITSRLKAQMSVEEKKKRADIIINNNGTLQEMYDSIDECLKVILC
ncbi:MAG: dephospho-CoA kinase [Erysipelotrichaceae bacterium]|nr:dephospho-CoA kinase [Erysipelotrichaceae bacterium]